jgi:hypothetical protein
MVDLLTLHDGFVPEPKWTARLNPLQAFINQPLVNEQTSVTLAQFLVALLQCDVRIQEAFLIGCLVRYLTTRRLICCVDFPHASPLVLYCTKQYEAAL